MAKTGNSTKENVASEPVVVYKATALQQKKKGSKVQSAEYDINIVLRGTTTKPENSLTTFEKMAIVNNGISKKGLEQLKTRSAIDYDRLAKMLATTKVTLINKKGDEKFSASLSEKILSVADVYSYGYEVFEDVERFNSWMLSPIRALGGKAPYEIMDNQFGREEVKNIIGRIEHGVYS
jgi:putative toxin-antitoxin system antitoxin component (TIGR02293 family)